MSSRLLLQHAFPLVRTHGFTRSALSLAALSIPRATHDAHAEPLSDLAVSALFGQGDEARRTLIRAWLNQGIEDMKATPRIEGSSPAIRDILRRRLQYNEPVLNYLPEAYALLASPTLGLPPLDLRPAMKHVARIADEACHVSEQPGLQLSWYTRRASLAAIYTAAELHQMTSPATASAFLDSLLETSNKVSSTVDETALYGSYIIQSWKGILKSYRMF